MHKYALNVGLNLHKSGKILENSYLSSVILPPLSYRVCKQFFMYTDPDQNAE